MGRSDIGSDEMAGIAELRTNVLVTLEDTPHALVAVTSPRDDVTRRDAAAALAAAAERTGRQVALINADVTEPPLVQRRVSADDEASAAAAGGSVVGSDAVKLVGKEFQRLLADAAGANDLVVVACPPVLDVAETRAVAARCTGTVLVASRRTSRRDDTVQAANMLRATGARILGVVLRQS